jgi:hypothetical protein
LQRIDHHRQQRARAIELVVAMIGDDQTYGGGNRECRPKCRRWAAKKQRFDIVNPRLIESGRARAP